MEAPVRGALTEPRETVEAGGKVAHSDDPRKGSAQRFTASAAGNECSMNTETSGEPPSAILFDRDDTLIVDVPYNGDPALVQPMPTARAALMRVRSLGIRTGVVSNQSGIARGWVTWQQVRRVNVRVEDLLGPFDVWRICPHAPEDGCACRKPQPGMILSAAEKLGLPPERVAVIGDIGADIAAAEAAGASAVLVPTARTLPGEREAAPRIAADLGRAVELLLGDAQLQRGAA